MALGLCIGLGFGANWQSSSHVQRATTFSTETTAVQTAATTAGAPLSEARQLRLDRAIARIKACGAWTALTAGGAPAGIYLMGESEAQFLINILSPGTNDLVKHGAPTFTANTSVAFPTTSDYYDTGIPANAVLQDSACMAVESITGGASANPDAGSYISGTGGHMIYADSNSLKIAGCLSCANTGMSDTSTADGLGWNVINRSLAASVDFSHHGVLLETIAKPSIAITSANTITLGKVNGFSSSPSIRQLRGFYLGGSLTADQHAEVCAALTDYLNCVQYGDPWIVEAGNGPDQISVDVCVYGLSMAACCAAYHAARRGLTVAMVGSPSDSTIWDIGGMPVNGVGWIDSKTPAILGGIFKDAITWINTVPRGSTDGTTQAKNSPEPRHWSMAVRRMLDPNRTGGLIPGQNVKVYMGSGIASVAKSGTRVTSITTVDGRTISASYFVGADYRGDLANLAGLPTITGREAAGTGGEAANGYRGNEKTLPALQSTNLTIDPYVTPGNSGSGLIADIQADPGLVEGAADPAHQSMNYRLTFTNGKRWKGQAVGTFQPSGYNATRYEKFGRMLAAATAASLTLTASDLITTTTTLAEDSSLLDVNASGAFSTDLAGSGISYAAAAGDITTARSVEADVRTYQQGLFYWIRNSGDARIQAGFKSSVDAYFLSALNHLDSGSDGILNWPKAVYLREPTFMLQNSGFILDGNDVAATDGTTPRSVKTIAPINYRSDIHTLRNMDSGGAIYREGGYSDTAAGGTDQVAPWPLEASLPDKVNCENFCTPTAPSMTKIAWAAARMEQSMSAAGESLGEVIYQAIQAGNIALQDVDYSLVRTELLSGIDNTSLDLPQTN